MASLLAHWTSVVRGSPGRCSQRPRERPGTGRWSPPGGAVCSFAWLGLRHPLTRVSPEPGWPLGPWLEAGRWQPEGHSGAHLVTCPGSTSVTDRIRSPGAGGRTRRPDAELHGHGSHCSVLRVSPSEPRRAPECKSMYRVRRQGGVSSRGLGTASIPENGFHTADSPSWVCPLCNLWVVVLFS